MHDPDPRPPLMHPRVLRGSTVVLGVFAAALLVAGGLVAVAPRH